MDEIFRNILRRKLRSFLTIFGIAIGIFALTVMGSMSEYFNNLISRSVKYSAEIVRVFPKSALAGPTSGIIKTADADQFKTIPEVKDIAPALFTTLTDQSGAASLLGGDFAIGLPPSISQEIFTNVGLDQGRYLHNGDTGKAIIGKSLATKLDLKIGSKKTFRGKEFEIVGIAKLTQVAQLDSLAIVPLADAQEINKLQGFANAVILIPKNKDDAQKIADTVKKDFPTFNALSPADIVNETKKGLLVFNIIVLAGAVLAAVVGGFSTLNTMIMAVGERTREIGIKKAIGASAGEIVREYLLEAGIIGLIGGTVGVILGFFGTLIINQITEKLASGLSIFSMTPRLAVISLIFAVVLSSIAGLLPAFRAARMNVVQALRSE